MADIITLTAKRKTHLYFLLASSMILLILTFMVPTAWALYLSFTDFRMGRAKEFVGLANYVRIFIRTPDFWVSLYRTLLFTVCMVAGEFVVGLAFSLAAARGYRFQKLLVAVIIAPIAVSPVVAIIIWRYMLSPNYGLINYLLTISHFNEPDWFGNAALVFATITVLDIWMNAPFVFIMLYPAILSINPQMIEAARIDGATSMQRFLYITMPSIKQVALTAVLFRFIFALRLFENIWLYSRGGPGNSSKVLSIYLYEQAFKFWNFGMGSAIAWILLIITMVLAMPQMRILLRSYR